jgi:GT2 family glycosyltransferase
MIRTVAIVIVSYNARPHLESCLDALLRTPPSLAHEVIVVDNASRDGSAEMVAARHGVSLVRNSENLGFARANNRAIRATTADAILLLNSDTEMPPGGVDALCSVLAGDPSIGVVGPRLIDAAGVPELSFGRMMTPFNEARQKLVVRLARGGFAPARAWVRHATSRRRVVDWVSGACLLVGRQTAVDAGLLDERYFMYAEDVDFCHAVRRLGQLVVFDPLCSVIHHGGASAATAASATYEAYRRSHLAFYRKHHARWAPWLEIYLRARGKLPPGARP